MPRWLVTEALDCGQDMHTRRRPSSHLRLCACVCLLSHMRWTPYIPHLQTQGIVGIAGWNRLTAQLFFIIKKYRAAKHFKNLAAVRVEYLL